MLWQYFNIDSNVSSLTASSTFNGQHERFTRPFLYFTHFVPRKAFLCFSRRGRIVACGRSVIVFLIGHRLLWFLATTCDRKCLWIVLWHRFEWGFIGGHWHAIVQLRGDCWLQEGDRKEIEGDWREKVPLRGNWKKKYCRDFFYFD